MDLIERLEKTAADVYGEHPERDGYISDVAMDAGIMGGVTGAALGGAVGNVRGIANIDDVIQDVQRYKREAVDSPRFSYPNKHAFKEGVKHQLGYAGRGARTGALIGGLGVGAIAAGNAAERHLEARDAIDEEQLASEELFEALEKVANESHPEKRDFTRGEDLAGLGMIAGGAGAGYGAGELVKRRDLLEQRRKDLEEAGRYSKLTSTKWTPATGEVKDVSPEYRRKLLEGMGKRTDEAIKAMDHKKHKMALAGGLLGTGAASVYGLTRDRDIPEEQLASEELIDALEKTAKLNLVSGVKGFGSKVLGTNQRSSKAVLDNANKNLAALSPDDKLFTGRTLMKEQAEKKLQSAKVDTSKARKQFAVGAGATAGVAGAGIAANNAYDNHRQKTASEEFMTGIYKEAAAHILDMHAPETKAYVDPMSKISFSK